MLDPRDILLSSYDYELPQERIAQTPTEPRHASRLLIVEDRNDLSLRHTRVWNLQEELSSGDLIVVNNTKVIKARLKVSRPGGGGGELLLIEPKGSGNWLCLAKPARKIREGDYLILEAPGEESIKLKVLKKDLIKGGHIIGFPATCFDFENIQELLEKFGQVPLPPYIKAQPNRELDEKCYQTGSLRKVWSYNRIFSKC